MGVWIETQRIRQMLAIWVSHPAWVCGLKRSNQITVSTCMTSHPAWVCGLKPEKHCPQQFVRRSHPAWVCGLKPKFYILHHLCMLSHPAWVCGLKQSPPCTVQTCWSHTLRGCVDWNVNVIRIHLRKTSHTLRGCVDWNLNFTVIRHSTLCHTLRGCVDWNKLMIPSNNAEIVVTPCVGVWIETMTRWIRV